MVRRVEARARRRDELTPRFWRRRGWPVPAEAWTPDREAPARIEDAGTEDSFIEAAAIDRASNGYGYRLIARK